MPHDELNPVTPANPTLSATAFVPEYAGPLQAELTDNQRRLAKVAAWLGAVPLTLGVLDFLLWIPTRAATFELGGLLIIYLGVFCTFIGGLLLLIQLCSIRGSGKLKLFFETSRIAIILLFINYPAALGIIFLVSQIGFHLD